MFKVSQKSGGTQVAAATSQHRSLGNFSTVKTKMALAKRTRHRQRDGCAKKWKKRCHSYLCRDSTHLTSPGACNSNHIPESKWFRQPGWVQECQEQSRHCYSQRMGVERGYEIYFLKYFFSWTVPVYYSCIFDLFKYCQFQIVVLSSFVSTSSILKRYFSSLDTFCIYYWFFMRWGQSISCRWNLRTKEGFNFSVVMKLERPPVIYLAPRISKYSSQPFLSTQTNLRFSLCRKTAFHYKSQTWAANKCILSNPVM